MQTVRNARNPLCIAIPRDRAGRDSLERFEVTLERFHKIEIVLRGELADKSITPS
jgi:hypothetical protein